jgi:thiol:disulfide interchange protein
MSSMGAFSIARRRAGFQAAAFVVVHVPVLRHDRAPLFPRLPGAIATVFAAVAAVCLAACGRHNAADEPTHVSENLVAFDPPASYPEIAWMGSLEEARHRAADEHKPMIVFVRAAWSRPSVVMESTIWEDSRVLAEAQRFVALRVDLTSTYGGPIPESLKDYDVKEVPTTIVVSSEGKIFGRFGKGQARPGEVAKAMREAK